MERLRGFPRRFRFPSRSTAQIRRDVDDELAFHLAEKTDALEREGLTRDEAREEALRQFGDMDTAREQLVAEDHRGERRSVRLVMFDDLIRDVRLAWRSLWRTPGFTVVAILVLALGIGVVSGASSIFSALALKPVMMEEPEEVLGVFAMRSEPRSFRAFSYPEYVDLRERVETFSSIAAFDIADTGVEEGGITRRAQTSFVSANYFETFGVPLARGRSFTLAEERGEEPAVAVVSHELWARNGADPAFLGSVIRVNNEPLIVVGIARRGFTGTMLVATDVWVPLASAERILGMDGGEAIGLRDARSRSLLLFGRLANGVATATSARSACRSSAAATSLPMRSSPARARGSRSSTSRSHAGSSRSPTRSDG